MEQRCLHCGLDDCNCTVEQKHGMTKQETHSEESKIDIVEEIMEELEDFYNDDDRIIEIGKFQLKCLLEKHLSK